MERFMDGSLAVDRSILSLPELEAQITELAGHLNAANYRWLSLIAEFDRRKGWADSATQSCAHWLNWKCGIDLGAAREKVRVAHALEKLPQISAAMAQGQVSYSKVRALTRVACAATEYDLLTIALYGTADHVEKVVRHVRRAEAIELSREAAQQENRSLSYNYDEDGSLVLKARLPAEAGALVVKALNLALAPISPPNVSAEISAETFEKKPTFPMRRADALAAVAENFIKHGFESLNGGDRHQIVVHVDAATLRDDTAGHCEFEDGPSIPAETARRLACDASIVTLIENARGEPLSVGRKTRAINPALRRALNARDQGCRFPGCSNKHFVDAHHVHHWAHGGETKASNLVTLCRFHHRKVHEGGVVVKILDDGAFRFVKPNGESFDSVAAGHTSPLGDWQQLPAAHHEQGMHIDKNTAATRWRGERMDYGLAVEGILLKAKRAQSVPGEIRGAGKSA